MSCLQFCTGGFGSYIFAMSDITSKQSTGANDPQNMKTLSLGWIIGFLFIVSFLGLFSVLPLRKVHTFEREKEMKLFYDLVLRLEIRC